MSVALTVLRTGTPRSSAPPRAPAAANRPGRLIDSHGRTIRDLRISITDRCNFRCVYCMEPDVRFMPSDSLLSVDEMLRTTRACVDLGIEKVRITGGEPTVHPELERIIRGLAELPLRDLAMTTNGSLMDAAALRRWKHAGLRRLTVSLDSVRPDRFRAVTRSRTSPDEVIEAIRRARREGFDPVKVNAVLVRGFNDDEAVGLAALARELDVEMRFIEFMPLDSGHSWDMSRVVSAAETLEAIGRVFPLRAVGRADASSTSLHFEFEDGAPGSIGVIAPVTRPFCGACSRLRLTADGKVRPCLFSRDEWDVRSLLRSGAGDAAIADFLVDATWTKQAGHGISTAAFEQPERPMSAIGG